MPSALWAPWQANDQGPLEDNVLSSLATNKNVMNVKGGRSNVMVTW